MRFSVALLSLAVIAFVVGTPNDASAGSRRAARMANQPVAAGTGTTILPSAAEIAAVPVPQSGQVLAYPVDVVRYGLTIHPGARIVRGLLSR